LPKDKTPSLALGLGLGFGLGLPIILLLGSLVWLKLGSLWRRRQARKSGSSSFLSVAAPQYVVTQCRGSQAVSLPTVELEALEKAHELNSTCAPSTMDFDSTQHR
jgi:hypothetical protein